jgi:ADP-ribosylglycohydrolase
VLYGTVELNLFFGGSTIKTSDRVRGVLLGLAAGDRIGGPIQMALRLAGSLLSNQGFDQEEVGKAYLEWWRSEGYDTGPTADRVFQLADIGKPFEFAASAVHIAAEGLTAGCNPAHRAAPLAMASWLGDDELEVVARADASLTHKHPLAGAAAASAVGLCRRLIKGADWHAARGLVAVAADPEIREAGFAGPEEILSTGGFAPDVLGAALFFVRTSASFAEALERSIDFAGASNYCPILVGSIGGARWGASAVPDEAVEHCAVLPEVRDIASALAGAWEEKS